MIGQAEFFITPQGTQRTYGACLSFDLGFDFLNDQNNEEAGKSLKKFTSAYVFQIAREKSCDYL